MKDIIQMSYLTIVANITLLLFVIFNSTLTARKRHIFLLSGCISLIMILCNIISYYYQGTGSHLWLLRIVNAISYTVSGPVVLPFIFLTAVINKRVRYTLIGLATLNAVLSIISIFTGWVFYFDGQGTLRLGPLSPLPYILSIMYILVLIAASILKYRLGFHGESVFITVLSISIILAVVLNTAFGFKFLISSMAVLATLFYYLFFTTQTLTRDALTNALNRHSFYKDVVGLKKKQMFVIAMDLNGLKQINDTQGHDEGDKAILAVSDSAIDLLPLRCRFYRMGGDEFEILYPGASYDEAEALAAKLKAAVQDKGYSVAIGFKEYTKGMDLDDVIREADAFMYEDKVRMKGGQEVTATYPHNKNEPG